MEIEESSRLAASDEYQMNMPDTAASKRAMKIIEDAKRRGNTLGGVFEVRAVNVPVGLGSYSQWDRKLDGRLAGALMSIQAIKGVEIGDGVANAGRYGSEVHDEIFYSACSAGIELKYRPCVFEHTKTGSYRVLFRT